MKRLNRLLAVPECRVDYADSLNSALDGQPFRELRRRVPIDQLRREGAFFTNSKLANRALGSIAEELAASDMIVDPTCGAGDLLLSSTQHFQVSETLSDTLKMWGRRIAGSDIHSEFVLATLSRLAISAIQRGAIADAQPNQFSDFFPNIVVGDTFENRQLLDNASHVVINPPFTMIESPKDCDWTRGTVNAAAIYMNHVLENTRHGTRIVAILPDVLRCGTRYQRWRDNVDDVLQVDSIEQYGRFDSDTNVDVFIIRGEKQSYKGTKPEWIPRSSSTSTVGDFFQVSIGSVVEFRHPKQGPWHLYVTPVDLPPWKEIKKIRRHRRFKGRVFEPPFVAVRRTSRPGDKHRAIATIVSGTRPVAVENHIVVLTPKSGGLRMCRKLRTLLRLPKTSAWLDRRIGCRHLTVSSLQDVPAGSMLQ